MEEMKQNTSWGTITQANCEGFRNFSRIALQRQLTVAPTGLLFQVETMLTEVHRLALFPQSLQCTHGQTMYSGLCIYNTAPSW